MRLLQLVLLHTTYLILVLMSMGATTARGSPDPMARPTRPEVIKTPEQLIRYLDHMKHYYTLSGKGRYGKRVDPVTEPPISEHPLYFLRLILAISRQNRRDQQRKEEEADDNELNSIPLIHPYERMTRHYKFME